MHRKMVKSDLISGGHIRPGPDMKIWPDFGRGQIWYPVQPYLQVVQSQPFQISGKADSYFKQSWTVKTHNNYTQCPQSEKKPCVMPAIIAPKVKRLKGKGNRNLMTAMVHQDTHPHQVWIYINFWSAVCTESQTHTNRHQWKQYAVLLAPRLMTAFFHNVRVCVYQTVMLSLHSMANTLRKLNTWSAVVLATTPRHSGVSL